MDTLTNILGTAGTILSIIFFASSGKSIFEGLKTGEIKNVAIVYLKIQAIMCSFWLFYGMKISDMTVLATNVSGFLLDMVFIIIYHYVYKEYQEIALQCAVSSSVLLISYFLNVNIVAFCAFIMALVCTAAMYIKIREALYTKDASFINLQIVVGGLVNSIIWILYGLLVGIFLVWFCPVLLLITVLINALAYLWTLGYVEDNNLFLMLLKKILMVEFDKTLAKNKLIDF
jgi:uncharacterized protein with PQ loop repeat